MSEVSSFRKRWNKHQGELRQLLEDGSQFDEAIKLCLSQHAALHAAELAAESAIDEPYSYADALLNDMTEEQIRRIPSKEDHSVAWLLWHMARIEDVAMNILVAGGPQIMNQADWLERMGIDIMNTGNLMDEVAVVELSAAVDVEALRAYRLAVGWQTRSIIQNLRPEQLKEKVDPARLERVIAEGAVVEEARDLIDYWGKRTMAGLLLMPATRHNFVHLNEAERLKKRRQ
jgi:hypothetical protein